MYAYYLLKILMKYNSLTFLIANHHIPWNDSDLPEIYLFYFRTSFYPRLRSREKYFHKFYICIFMEPII